VGQHLRDPSSSSSSLSSLPGSGSESYTPQFTYHAFQYAQVDNWPVATHGAPTVDDFEARALRSDVEVATAVSSSSPVLDAIDEMTRNAFKANWAQGIQSDCPGRERLGYGGDVLASAGGGLSQFDSGSFYRKRADDYAESQMSNGGLPETAPWIGISSCSLGGNSGPVEWGAALVWL